MADSVNTSRSNDDLKFGFFRTSLKSPDGKFFCAISTDDDWYLECFKKEDFVDAYEYQLPFLRGHGVPSGFVVNPVRANENYAYVRMENGGFDDHTAILRKMNGEWKVIHAGVDLPPCNLMIENNVPSSIYYDQCR